MVKKQTIEELQAEVERLRNFMSQVQDLSSGLVDKNGNVHEDIVERIRNELEHLRELVFYDDLTSVLNRRGFFDRFDTLFKEALFTKTHSDLRHAFVISGFAVIFIDLDDFKQINDTFGHNVGDDILTRTARFLKDSIRESDGVARFGGEEFVCALPGSTEEQAYTKAVAILQHLKENITTPDQTSVTASIGVAGLDVSDARTLADLAAYADKAMYEAKTVRGKDAVVQFSEIV